MAYRVGSVPYVNAVPLARPLESLSEVEVVYDLPSKLPALLDSGAVDAILVSSIFCLVNPDIRMARGAIIGSDGPVTSVKIFSKVPMRAIQSLALDSSSMTSNRLAKIVLEHHGLCPQYVTLPPNLDVMLEQCDAAVLIGDIGMSVPERGLRVFDLGEEWKSITGLPFLWAGWAGRERLTPELAHILNEAAVRSGCGRDAESTGLRNQMIEASVAQTGLSPTVISSYLLDTMVYRWSSSIEKAYREYARRLSAPCFPELIGVE